ncbi:MAG: DUF933 domain-containing protein, partial [Fidelibacterota bacterium]
LNLITFFTIDPPETRAWTVEEGTKVPRAGGKIHTDFERGFIKAEVIKYEDLIDYGSVQAVRDKGLILTGGRDYIVEDGDIIHFKFKV